MAVPTPPIDIENLTNKFEASTVDAGDLLVAGIAVAGGFLLGAIVRAAVRRLLSSVPGITSGTAGMIARISGYIIVVFGLVIALSAVGLSFGPVITLLLMVALIAVLIGRPLLADLGAGVVLQSRRPVQIGDVIRIDDDEGIVEDVDGRVVLVRTFEGWSVRVRNSDVLSTKIVSAGAHDRVRVEFVIGVEYDTDLDAAVEVARASLERTSGVVDEPAPSVLVDEFDDSTINLRCWFWVEPVDRWIVKDVAMRDVKRALDAEGIVIAFPQRVLRSA